MGEDNAPLPALGEEYRWALTKKRKDGLLIPKEQIGQEYHGMLTVQIVVCARIAEDGFWAYGTTIQTLLRSGEIGGETKRYKRKYLPKRGLS